MINSSRGWLEEMSVQGLQPGTSYRVRVVAQAEAGAGVTSEVSTLFFVVFFSIIIFLSLQVITVTTQHEVELPRAPANLTARPTSAFSILVTWDSPGDSVSGSGQNRITKSTLYHERARCDS